MKPKRGRPISDQPREGGLSALGVRVAPALKTKLAKAAKETGRSLGAEALARIASTFPTDDRIDSVRSLLGENAGVLLYFAEVISRAAEHAEWVVALTGDRDPPTRVEWLTDARIYQIVERHLIRAIRDLRPPGEPEKLVSEDGFSLEPIVEKAGVNSVICDLLYRGATPAWGRNPRVELIAEILGEALVDRLRAAEGMNHPSSKGETP